MKKLLSTVKSKLTGMAVSAKTAVANAKAETYVDTGVKILIAVVIGALLLTLLYGLFSARIFPTLTEKIEGLFEFTGD